MSTPSTASFLWGASTSAHQTEGNNINSDWWFVENQEGAILPERSGDADDSYHRYREDIDLLAGAGLTAYRFSIEWARVEPAAGHFSTAELAHYRDIIDYCISVGVEPVVTLHHFSHPLWFAQMGGWTHPDSIDLFARYVQAVVPILSAGVRYVVTINEPNTLASIGNVMDMREIVDPLNMPEPIRAVFDALAKAHKRAVGILREAGLQAGWSVSARLFHTEPGDEAAARTAARLSKVFVEDFLEVARGDDFIGVQAYTYVWATADGVVNLPEGTRLTKNGWPFYPQALPDAVAQAHSATDLPVLVTENGIATDDDSERIEYIEQALTGLRSVIDSGASVLGYLHWSLLDNYEWGSFYPTFGLVAVDRETFVRTPKPSLKRLGELARG